MFFNVGCYMLSQLVHADLCGSEPEKSLGGNKYFLVLKDFKSKYRTDYLRREKSAVKEILYRYLAEVKSTGYARELLTDGRSELNSSDVYNIVKKAHLNNRKSLF